MSEENIFREVDEDLRRERFRGLWRRYGGYVIGAAVLVVLLVALSEGWTWWVQKNSAQSADQLYAALELADKGDVTAAQQALDTVAANGTGQYPLLAHFREAGMLAADGQTDKAVAAYDAIASESSEQRLRELALVLAAFTLVDRGDVSAVQTRVGTIASSSSPLRNTAREAVGLVQYKAGDLDAAKATFDEISKDPAGSLDQLRRVQVYIAQLLAEGVGVDPADVEPVVSPGTAVTEPVVPEASVPTAPATEGASQPSAAPAQDQPATAPVQAEPLPQQTGSGASQDGAAQPAPGVDGAQTPQQPAVNGQ